MATPTIALTAGSTDGTLPAGPTGAPPSASPAAEPPRATEPEKPPLVFVSHRHHDHVIAKAVAEWLSVATTSRVDIFLSSDGLQGAEVARSITEQIRTKVAQAAVLIAVYSDEDADWAWVMFEMGIAMDPMTPVTKVVILQCGEDIPAILSDFKRVHASNAADRVTFARDLQSEGFFPTHPSLKLAGNNGTDELAKQQADLLWEKLKDLVPPPDVKKRDWSPYPSIRVEVPLIAVGALWPVDAERLDGLRMPIKAQGKVVEEDDTRTIFNLHALAGRTLSELELALGLADQAGWIDSCVQHLANCLVGNRPTEPMQAVRSVSGVMYQPLVEWVQHKWFDRVIRFDVMFIPAPLLGSTQAPPLKKAAGRKD